MGDTHAERVSLPLFSLIKSICAFIYGRTKLHELFNCLIQTCSGPKLSFLISTFDNDG